LAAGGHWIRKPPNAEFATEVSDREWIFDVAELLMIHGGNTQQ